MKALFIGCHCDDIELGCGGTIHRFREEWDIGCLILSTYPPKLNLDLTDVTKDALTSLGVSNIWTADLPTREFAENRQKLWQTLHNVQRKFQPDIVFANAADKHQDHQALANETVRVFTNISMVYYYVYELCPNPTFRIRLQKEDVDAKLASLEIYRKYYDKSPYFDRDRQLWQLKSEDGFSEVFNATCWYL